MQINIAATFTVLEQWPYQSCQFFDVFPFRGVWTRDWWYGNVLWLTSEGRWKTMDTVKATMTATRTADHHGRRVLRLYSSDRATC